MQQRPHEYHTKRSHNNCYYNRKHRRIADTLPKTVYIPGSEPLGRQNRKSRGQSLHKAQNQKHDCSCCSDCRQCIDSHSPADNDRIHHIIKLLKNIAYNKRNHKPYDQSGGTSLRHIKFHNTPRLFPSIPGFSSSPALIRIIYIVHFPGTDIQCI